MDLISKLNKALDDIKIEISINNGEPIKLDTKKLFDICKIDLKKLIDDHLKGNNEEN